MEYKRYALLNTSILTAYGKYEYEPISLEEVIEITHGGKLVNSMIGHESTAQILSKLLRYKIEVNREFYIQKPKETAIVFKLKGRPEEGKILTVEEIERIGYEFGRLIRWK